MFSASVLIVLVASLSAVVYQLLFVSLPVASIHIYLFQLDYLQFCFCFVRLFSVQLLNYSVLFFVLILE